MHNEEFHNLYSSPNSILLNKRMRMGRDGHAACMGEMKHICKFSLKIYKEDTNWEAYGWMGG
jgi:hypothetical protein